MVDAVEAAKAKVGGPGALAKLLGKITPQAVSQWRRVPAERVIDVEKATGVSRHELRPDIYPPGDFMRDTPSPPAPAPAEREAAE